MPTITYRQALNDALSEEVERETKSVASETNAQI